MCVEVVGVWYVRMLCGEGCLGGRYVCRVYPWIWAENVSGHAGGECVVEEGEGEPTLSVSRFHIWSDQGKIIQLPSVTNPQRAVFNPLQRLSRRGNTSRRQGMVVAYRLATRVVS